MKFSNQLLNIKGRKGALRIIAVLILLALFAPWAQSQKLIRCHTMENLERLMQEHPEYKLKRDLHEKQIDERAAQQKGMAFSEITIPVVFHIIHNGDAVGSGENISNAHISAQMAQLNDDYRRNNSDAGSTPLEFQDEATDVHVEFCLATTDPDGNPTTGIERIDISTLPGVSLAACWEDFYIDANIKIPTIWNSHLYLNIWVVEKIDDACSPVLFGYAQYPDMGPDNTDGVVVIAGSVGSLVLPSGGGAPFDRGRTLTHEVGHWLNLYHIWGDDLGLCTGSDFVGDTPNQADANGGCPAHPKISCGNNEMFMNFMDFTDDLCMNLFTQGQSERVQAAIEEFRPGTVSDYCGNCPANLRLTQTEPGTFGMNTVIGYDVDFTLEASNTIASGAEVEYRAGRSIRLLPDPVVAGSGFWAQSGSQFHAYIQDCDGSTVKPEALTFRQGVKASGPGGESLEFSISPNPSTGNFLIKYRLHTEESIYLSVSSPTGSFVSVLKNGDKETAGEYQVSFDAHDLPAGVYNLLLSSESKTLTKKLVLMK